MSNLSSLFDDKEGVSLIDLSQIALATASVTVEAGTKFTVPMLRTLILSTLKHNALKFKSEGFNKTVICVDNAKFGYWRRQFADYYKRNRAIAREKEAEKEVSFDWEGFFNALVQVISELKEFMPYTVMDVKFCEADDCIAVITKYCVKNNIKVRIISSDGDFTQLHLLEDVDQYSPVQKKFVKCKTGSPEEDCLVKIIKGDKKDGVASIKVRSDYWLTYDPESERTPSTSSKFITDLVGKSDDEIKEVFLSEIMKKASVKKINKETKLPVGLEYCINQLSLYGVHDASFVNTEINTLAEKILEIQMNRFIENRVLIDFNYIREDIKESILNEYLNYKPAPRSKMYSYFVKTSQTKLLKEINSF